MLWKIYSLDSSLSYYIYHFAQAHVLPKKKKKYCLELTLETNYDKACLYFSDINFFTLCHSSKYFHEIIQ